MTKRERILIGGVGGLVPVLMFLITGDFDRFFSHFALGVLCGYLVRATVLFFIGGFVANLYQEETQRIKVFQLGLGAPAMIAGFLAVSPAKAPAFVIMPIAHAQAAVTGSGDLKQFTLPETSGIEEFFEGLTDRKSVV